MNYQAPPDVRELLQEAEAYSKQELHDKAITAYALLWTEHRNSMSIWDCWRYARSLRKVKRSEEALFICEHVHQQNPSFAYNNHLLGWCLYDLKIKGKPFDTEEDKRLFREAVDRIVTLTPQEQFSPYEFAVCALLKNLSKMQQFPARQVLDWTTKLNPQNLSEENRTFSLPNGREGRYPSNKETWYKSRTKALNKLNRHPECLELCEVALGELKIRDREKVWFHWRIAKSLVGLGRKEEAIPYIQLVLNVKKDWFIYDLCAEIHFQSGNYVEALKNSAIAALGDGDSKNKYKLFLRLAQIYELLDEADNASQHTRLALAAWQQISVEKTPSTLLEALDRYGLTLLDALSMHEIETELRKQWRQAKYAGLPQYTGVIKTVLAHGKAGFIRGNNGKDYYFDTREYRGRKDDVRVGLEIQFYVEMGFDPKRKEEKEQAVGLRIRKVKS